MRPPKPTPASELPACHALTALELRIARMGDALPFNTNGGTQRRLALAATGIRILIDYVRMRPKRLRISQIVRALDAIHRSAPGLEPIDPEVARFFGEMVIPHAPYLAILSGVDALVQSAALAGESDPKIEPGIVPTDATPLVSCAARPDSETRIAIRVSNRNGRIGNFDTAPETIPPMDRMDDAELSDPSNLSMARAAAIATDLGEGLYAGRDIDGISLYFELPVAS